ncbi:MAG: KGK domain-containing protein [Cyanobacteriota bacterium]|nr:KGK domain-containing protein [Cyanobacteriota bacterium]
MRNVGFEGVECEVLAPGKPWRKGKIKVSFEFIPDEPESPLDDIRRDMEKYNS